MSKNTLLKISQILSAAWPDAQINIDNPRNDGKHFDLHVATTAFKGLSLIDQHRLVNSQLKELLKGEVHALSISTKALD